MALKIDIRKTLGAFSLEVAFEAGEETVALLGASGSGKSMTLRCVAGVEKPDRGQILLDGRPLFDSEKHVDLVPQKRRVGLMFQHYALFPQMTVLGNVMCSARRGFRGGDRKKRALEALEAFGIRALADLRPGQLSGGQQQRAALARMLVSGPEILLLDEPFSALDAHLRFRMEQEMREVIRRFGKTVLLVSHDRDEVYRLADRVVILRDGHVERTGTRRQVFEDPGTRAAAALTGCKNLSGIRKLNDGEAYALEWGIPLRLRLKPDTEALGIRMHALRHGEGVNAFECRVEEVIENPFSFTVLLRPLEAPEGTRPIGWETDKETWTRVRGGTVRVCLPPEALLQLKG